MPDNKLGQLPEEMCMLQQMQSMNLNNNQLKNLPFDFGNFANMTDLDIENNNIRVPPLFVCKVSSQNILHKIMFRILFTIPPPCGTL